MKNYVCIDVGGTSIKYGFIREDGFIIDKSSLDTEAKEKRWRRNISQNKRYSKKYIEENEISGICISTAGMVDPVEGKILFALEELIPNYKGMQLKKK